MSPERRDELQQQFLAGAYQVLVSTDAGGEGIDLQSAHVMIDWDIPWSLVRLEQRAGRLHRIGQTHDVFVYHLVAPATREGRVQEVMLNNLAAAGQALGGRIFDLMDATAFRADFDYAAALTASQRTRQAGDALVGSVPTAETLVRRAREVIAEEDRFAIARGRGRCPRALRRRPRAVDQPGDRLRVRRPGRRHLRLGVRRDRTRPGHPRAPLRQAACPPPSAAATSA